MQYYTNNYQCFGKDKRTGTSALCAMHNCSNERTQFCFYPNNEIVHYVDNKGKIPIKAWGTVEAQYYGHKQLDKKQGCSKCKVSCIQGGIHFYSNKPVLAFKVCAEPFCLIKKQPNIF